MATSTLSISFPQAADATPFIGLSYDREFDKYDLTKHIPEEDRLKIGETLTSLSDTTENIHRICHHLETGSYHSIEPEDFHHALKGFFDGICEAKIVIRLSDILTLKMHGIEFDCFDPVSKDGLSFDLPSLSYFIETMRGYINQKALGQFLEQLRTMSRLERWIIRFRTKKSEQKTILDRLEDLGVKLFTSKSYKVIDSRERCLPSLELFTLFTRTSFKRWAVTPKPVFGAVPIRQVAIDAKTNERVISCAYLVEHQLKQIAKADGFLSPHIEFNLHDRFHIFAMSSVPPLIRKIAISSAEHMRRHAALLKDRGAETEKKILYHLAWKMVDMDFPVMRNLRVCSILSNRFPYIPHVEDCAKPLTLLQSKKNQKYLHYHELPEYLFLEAVCPAKSFIDSYSLVKQRAWTEAYEKADDTTKAIFREAKERAYFPPPQTVTNPKSCNHFQTLNFIYISILDSVPKTPNFKLARKWLFTEIKEHLEYEESLTKPYKALILCDSFKKRANRLYLQIANQINDELKATRLFQMIDEETYIHTVIALALKGEV
ncbi:MAG: hypothetical protein K9M07_06475 [Simkaniaceae bacterium]|nr:hypothetical protein [Simkaniaceae bacterium]MCF7852868.1 hypothetical protein [Simkaniaceae bacterium]